ncbi:uncharacterized protein LOC109138582 isoform X2 [Larimichthys crocea]|uniref:uncharacterized protein LOC109138582 isoform X2 n=1 Tax=Larimichthys crocea TaxID=215358 RepID=UPI000F5EF7FF|nr:uncharacterized protein LOC109138582 isoform X2 [Larimichthys crocea]
MVQFSWIKVSLSVVLLLQFTAVTGQNQPFTVRVGDDVTLPCGNVTKDQNKCDTTTWKVIWKEVDAAVELVHLGQIRKYSIIEDISGRLSVTENCSLVIKKVTVGDVGRYTCLKSGEQQGPDSHVYLSVVHIEKQQANDSVVLTCAVVTYAGCGYTVQWLHDDDKPVTETSQFGCSAIMTFKKSDNVLLKCKVTDDESGRTLLSSFSLQSSAVTGQNQRPIVRVGDDVTLPCGNVMKDQNKCDTTTWTSRWKERDAAVQLVTLGQISKREAKSDRLSVTENCSLVIKKVTVDDVGRYTCLKSGKQQDPDSHVYLTVVKIDKDQTDESVYLSCDVLTYAGCGYTVQWLYDDDKPVTDTVKSDCADIMTFSFHHHQKSDNVLLKCKVTDDESGRTLLSSFSLQSSGNLWIIIVSVGSAALLIVIVAVMIWKKSKGRETQTDGNTEQSLNPAETLSAPQTSEDTTDPEDGVPYASISFIRQTDSEARVCGDGDDAVTYATVKPSSSSAGASADLYATVNHPKTNGAAV